MGGMNKYKEIQMKIYGWTGNQTWDPCITSQVLYHWAIQVDIHCSSSPIYHNMYSIWEYSHTQINRYPTYSYNKTQAPVRKTFTFKSLFVDVNISLDLSFFALYLEKKSIHISQIIKNMDKVLTFFYFVLHLLILGFPE